MKHLNKSINFQTTPLEHGQLNTAATYSGALGYGARESVLVDGEPLEFSSPDIIPSLEHAIRTIWPRFNIRRRSYDCVDFVGLMTGLKPSKDNPFEVGMVIDDAAAPDIFDTPIIFMKKLSWRYPELPIHTLLPARTSDGTKYLHKLGDDGPLCISTLDEARLIFDNPTAITTAKLRDKY
jgi:hypothetical protein